MAEEFARNVNGVDLCYQTLGDPGGPALLLIMGLSAPMVWWDDEFCAVLAERGFHVIRFDNRDTGRSTYLRGRNTLTEAYVLHRSPYGLSDLARDAVALLDHLGIGSAHVVGASMGGMVGQLLAIEHPDRIRSLASIMSTTGNRLVGRPSMRGMATLLSPVPRDRDAYIARHVRVFRTIGSPGYPFDPERFRRRAALTFDRGINPAGAGRHLTAVLSATDRTARLRRLQLPVSVIHGAQDRLVHVSGGLATVRAIPDAELHVMSGMGHDLPPQLFPRFADIIESTATRAKV